MHRAFLWHFNIFIVFAILFTCLVPRLLTLPPLSLPVRLALHLVSRSSSGISIGQVAYIEQTPCTWQRYLLAGQRTLVSRCGGFTSR